MARGRAIGSFAAGQPAASAAGQQQIYPTFVTSTVRKVIVLLPDSIELSEQEIKALILEKAAASQSQSFAPAGVPELVTLLGRPVPPEEVADIRHLIGLYYAERAADLFDALWVENNWTADTMHEWLREHMRTAHGRPNA